MLDTYEALKLRMQDVAYVVDRGAHLPRAVRGRVRGRQLGQGVEELVEVGQCQELLGSEALCGVGLEAGGNDVEDVQRERGEAARECTKKPALAQTLKVAL